MDDIKNAIVAQILVMLNKLSIPKSKHVSDYDIDSSGGEATSIIYFRSNLICYLFITNNNLIVNKRWPYYGKFRNFDFIVPLSDPRCFDKVVEIVHTKMNTIADVSITLL